MNEEKKIMKNNKNQQGFILVLSLIFISLIIMLSTAISHRARVHTRYAKVMLDREQAKMLAFSGLQIAMTQLAILLRQAQDDRGEKGGSENQTKDKSPKKDSDSSKDSDKDKKKKPRPSSSKSTLWTEKEAKEFIKNVFPLLNQWQEFKLTPEKYGLDGVVKICIGSEEGKINLNEIFDFEKRKFIGEGGAPDKDFKKIFAELFKKMGKFVKTKELQKNFETYLTKKQQFEKIFKNRQNRLYDVTEFLDLKGFESFADKVFYEKPIEIKKGAAQKSKPEIFWTDIFTIWSGSKEINAWFISPSLKRILGFKEVGQKAAEGKQAKELEKKFKMKLSFPADWDSIFAPMYGVKHKDLPKWFKAFISQNLKFEPKVFTVISYGTAGNVTQKIFAIIERKKVERNKKKFIDFEIKKFYWI